MSPFDSAQGWRRLETHYVLVPLVEIVMWAGLALLAYTFR